MTKRGLVLVDTSAWVEFLRGTGSQACSDVEQVLGGRPATCDPIRMEVLAGARDESHLDQLRRLLARTATLSTGPGDYEAAALLYRQCRRLGLSIRSLLDCLVAAIALREGASVLHADRDFPAIAQCAPLGLYRPT